MLVLLALLACSHPVVQSGHASWYGRELAGRPTASGEPFQPGRRTAAHPTLPFGTVVKVTRTDTGRSVRVVINDRGPYHKNRGLDVSREAARRLRDVSPRFAFALGCTQAEAEGKPQDIGAGQAGRGEARLHPCLAVEQSDPQDAEEMQPEQDEHARRHP
ncbi:MAG: septal ring lytic transglycosylase RlpA family protein [Myxococcales bacterium]